MANTDYNFQYTPLTGRLPGNSFVKQTEQAINELAEIVNEGAAQVEVITNLANTANNNSEEALEKATEALETAGRVYITLPNLDDADDYFDSQLYYFANSHSANLPVEDTGFLEVKTNDTKTAAEQVFIADTTGLMYMRHGDITSTEVGDETVYSVTWETWSSELASQDYVQREIVNYLPLSGGTLTGALTLADGGTALSNATVGTIESNSISSSVSLIASTAKTLTSVSLGAGVWIVKGNVLFSSPTADKVYGIEVGVTEDHFAYSNSGANSVHSSSNTNVKVEAVQFVSLAGTTTVYLNGYSAGVAGTVLYATIMAIRIA